MLSLETRWKVVVIIEEVAFPSEMMLIYRVLAAQILAFFGDGGLHARMNGMHAIVPMANIMYTIR